MKIAFIHYHLKQGGVTTVLKQQVEALKGNCEILVLTGEAPDTYFPADTVHIPGLGYYNGTDSHETCDPQKVAESVKKAVLQKFNGECDILHVHNPTLAKNKNFLKILNLLQKSGIKLFLQIHDFAEDGRPLAFFADREYPPDSHYCVINSRDYDILLDSGLKKEGLHNLPNVVIPFNFKQEMPDCDNSVLYPVRAIRRKNIGEAILLSLFFKKHETLSITLPPNSQPDIKSFIGWKKFVIANKLNIKFDAGLNNDFKKLVNNAEFLITTSITEGFGFTFLETWTGNKVLWGRKLAGVCNDFEKNGINMDHLYSKILVPVEWIGIRNLYEKWKKSWIKSCTTFNFNGAKKNIDKLFNRIIIDNHIDFGLLDEQFQKKIILKVISAKENASRLLLKNPHLALPNDLLDEKKLIRDNAQAVVKFYSKKIYTNRLLKIYSKVINNSVHHKIDKSILISHFLIPEQFSLLKWGEYVE